METKAILWKLLSHRTMPDFDEELALLSLFSFSRSRQVNGSRPLFCRSNEEQNYGWKVFRAIYERGDDDGNATVSLHLWATMSGGEGLRTRDILWCYFSSPILREKIRVEKGVFSSYFMNNGFWKQSVEEILRKFFFFLDRGLLEITIWKSCAWFKVLISWRRIKIVSLHAFAFIFYSPCRAIGTELDGEDLKLNCYITARNSSPSRFRIELFQRISHLTV